MPDIKLDHGPLAEVTREVGEGTTTLVFTRLLDHAPGKIWRALTDPAEQLEWLPFVANRNLTELGAARLRMTDSDQEPPMELEGEVLESEPPRLLRHHWGDDVLTWQLDRRDDGTLLTLRHTMASAPALPLASYAAGWHICLAVADRYLDGQPIGRVVGQRAMEFGWADLDRQYQETLKAPGAGDSA